MVKTWRYSSLKEFEQTMFSISEISRIYSLFSLKKTLNVSHFISTQYRNIFVSHVSLLFQLFHYKYRRSYYFLLLEQFWLLSNYSLQNELWDRFTELRIFTSDITFKICITYVFINNLFHFDVIQQ